MTQFSPAGSGGSSASSVSSYSIVNVSLPTANTEETVAVPSSAVWIQIKNRTDGLTKLAFLAGQSGITYVTIWPGDSHEYVKSAGPALSLYLQCPKAGQVLEITYGHE